MTGGRVVRLGVNVDHVATLREVRRVDYPDPVEAALLAEAAGADSITMHLREDRRHIQEHDVERVRARLRTKLNLEMAVTPEMVDFALHVRPEDVCLVPERREELTTEGGLDVGAQHDRIAAAAERLRRAGIRVSLFVAPDPLQLRFAAGTGAAAVELHTGEYANARDAEASGAELQRLRVAAGQAAASGLQVNAGHGLTVANVAPVARIPGMVELNIGHSIVARAVLVGMAEAVREMKEAIAS